MDWQTFDSTYQVVIVSDYQVFARAAGWEVHYLHRYFGMSLHLAVMNLGLGASMLVKVLCALEFSRIPSPSFAAPQSFPPPDAATAALRKLFCTREYLEYQCCLWNVSRSVPSYVSIGEFMYLRSRLLCYCAKHNFVYTITLWYKLSPKTLCMIKCASFNVICTRWLRIWNPFFSITSHFMAICYFNFRELWRFFAKLFV